MSREQAKRCFLYGDLYSIRRDRPLGITTSALFAECASYAYGSELDEMGKNCLQLVRTTGESDVEYRDRLINAAYAFLDITETCQITKVCHHKWVDYKGLFETDTYCEICKEKKK